MNTVIPMMARSRHVGFEARDLTIPADLGMLATARDWADSAAADFGLPADDRFQVKLAASEAVTNAILHGSASKRDAIELVASEERGALVFEVRDRANASSAPGGAAATRLEAGGRGLELVRLVMDEVELDSQAGGSVLRFAKRGPSAAAA